MLKRLSTLAMGLLLGSAGWAADMDADSFTIRDIRLEGLMRVSPASVYAQLPLASGDKISGDRVSDAVRSLFGTGNFEDVAVERDGDVLVFRLTERPAITDVKLEGNKAIDTDTLMDALKKAGLTEGEVFRRSTMDHIRSELERQYMGQGRYDATIKVDAVPKPRNRVGLHIQISEGTPARIRAINFVGNRIYSDKELAGLFQSRSSHVTSFFKGDDKYSRERLNGDIETLRSWYLDHGYINAAITSTQVTLSPDKRDVYIDVNINEGEKYTFGEAKLMGEFPVDEKELRKLLLIKPGEFFSQQRVTTSVKLLSSRLGNDGYLFADINPVPDIDEKTRTVNLSFFINPGKPTFVRRISFQGNQKTDDVVLRREMRQFEGSLAASDKLDLSKLRLQRLGYFKEVALETPRVPNTADQVDVNVHVEEQPSGTLSASVGYSQGAGLIFTFSVSQNNFFGTGNKVAVNLNRSDTSDAYNLSFVDPYFTQDGISRGYNLYYRKTKFDNLNVSKYVTDAKGGNISFSYPIDEIRSISLALGLDQTDITTGTYASQLVQDFVKANGNSISSYTGTLAWNYSTLNRGVFADKGAAQRLALDVAIPGSDVNYFKLSYSGQLFIPINNDFTVRLRTDLGYGYHLPFYKNFFAGGYGSVRGYRDNRLGPRSPSPAYVVDPDPEYVGGNILVENSAELIVPTPFAKDNRQLRTVFFVDSGMAYHTELPGYGFDPGTIRYTTGISLAWLTAIGPLSFSLSRPLNKVDGDETQAFQFTIGQSL
ncbi:Beta-barrel assembly machine subunit BamA [Fluviicoccus keumensis]|uniref:Outer membrane protein assembly factor BamA n=1 Tax=Fluviicoccus keumensis TaxID=1435465 RepID=A0A4Q7Z3I4_9GAMM|nr:outer membrane protein assembly factor BamA [Fluviicoccus keumensis]RZU44840.1 Beta-barrel assembly machine subunit BamA [Fluviicoccus keumensis]